MEADDDEEHVNVVVLSETGYIPCKIQFNPDLTAIPWELILDEINHRHIRKHQNTPGTEIHIMDLWINKVANSSKLAPARRMDAHNHPRRMAIETLLTYLPTLSMVLRDGDRIDNELAQHHHQLGGFFPYTPRNLNTEAALAPTLTTGLMTDLTNPTALQEIATIIGISVVYLGD